MAYTLYSWQLTLPLVPFNNIEEVSFLITFFDDDITSGHPLLLHGIQNVAGLFLNGR